MKPAVEKLILALIKGSCQPAYWYCLVWILVHSGESRGLYVDAIYILGASVKQIIPSCQQDLDPGPCDLKYGVLPTLTPGCFILVT